MNRMHDIRIKKNHYYLLLSRNDKFYYDDYSISIELNTLMHAYDEMFIYKQI